MRAWLTAAVGRVVPEMGAAPEKREVTGSTPVRTTTKPQVSGGAGPPADQPIARRARSVPEVPDLPGASRGLADTHRLPVDPVGDLASA